MPEKLTNIPTNLITGFLGVGKTTAILDLLKQKPQNENWAILVNEFGKIGVDGAIFSATGTTVKEIAGGCLCCAVALPFQVSVNCLLKEVRPDRLLIEPTGLGHPKKVMDMLVNGSFREVLDVRASICLVDPEKLKDSRYTTHETFVDQIALSDVLVANKMDLADREASKLFNLWAEKSKPKKAMIAQTSQGQMDVAWLDIPKNSQRQASYPDAHQISKINSTNTAQPQLKNVTEGYQSVGYVFPAENCFDQWLLIRLFSQLKAERIKGIFNSNNGWIIFNSVDGNMTNVPSPPSANSRVEIIAMQNDLHDISTELNQCRIDNSKL